MFDIQLGDTITKEFFEHIINYCISKKVIEITEDITISPIQHFNKVLQAQKKCTITVPKFEVSGFCFYVRNGSANDVITIRPQDCTIDGNTTDLILSPEETYLLTSLDSGDYVILNSSGMGGTTGNFGIREIVYLADKDILPGSVLNLPIDYIVGDNGLTLSVDGNQWYRDFQYEEMGDNYKRSTHLYLLKKINKGEEIRIRIINPDLLHTSISEITFSPKENLNVDTTYSLPNGMQYVVGSNTLTISVEGLDWYQGYQYTEIGNIGKKSSDIQLYNSISTNDQVRIRIIGLDSVTGCPQKHKGIIPGIDITSFSGILPKNTSTIPVGDTYNTTDYYIELYLSGIKQLNISWNIAKGNIELSETLNYDIPYEVVIYTINSKEGIVSYSGVISKGELAIKIDSKYTDAEYYFELFLSGVKQVDTGWSINNGIILLSDNVTEDTLYEVIIYPRKNTPDGDAISPDVTSPPIAIDPNIKNTVQPEKFFFSLDKQSMEQNSPQVMIIGASNKTENISASDTDALGANQASPMYAYYDSANEEYIFVPFDENSDKIKDLEKKLNTTLTKVQTYYDYVLPKQEFNNNYKNNDLFFLLNTAWKPVTTPNDSSS